MNFRRPSERGHFGGAIGLALTLIHPIRIPVTNTSVNPARSTGPALVTAGLGDCSVVDVWVAPLIGGALAGIFYRLVWEKRRV